MTDGLLPTDEERRTQEEDRALDGEDAGALVGILTSERRWVVAPWIKAVSFWVALLSVVGLIAWETHKRVRFLELLVDAVVEPEAWGNRPAPDFSLPVGADGPALALSSLRGKWVFVNFWATWCPPCREEMPSMEMMNRHLKDQNIVVLAVSVDESYAEVTRFFGETSPSFRVLWDREKVASRAYGTNKFPESYLIDPQGKVVAKFTGPRDWNAKGTLEYFTGVIAGTRKPVG